ncbi:unnamed protein product, partial [Closterium sp. NIES-53]
RVSGQGHERYFLLVVDEYSRYTTVFPLRSKGDITEVLIDWIRGARRQLSESFGSDLPVLRLHSDRGGEFSSDLLRAFCRAEGIRLTFSLPASPQLNGIAERRIGMVMDVARTSMIHAAAPHFQWPFAVQYAAHQINLQPRVSLPETTPTLRWTRKVGDVSVFRVWGSRAYVRDTSADKLSSRADVTFDELVSYYRLFPYRTASLLPPPLFLALGTPPVDPLPPTGPTPLGLSQVDPAEPVEVAVDSGAARGAEPAGAGTGGAKPGVSVSEGADPGVAEPKRVESGGGEPGGAESGRAEPGGAEPKSVESGDAKLGGTASGDTEPERAKSGGPPCVPLRREPLSPQQLRGWYARHCCGAASAGGASGAAGGAAGAGAAGGGAGVGAAGGAGVAGSGGARIGGTGAAGSGGAAGVGAAGAGAISSGGASGAGAVGGTGAGGAAGVEAGAPGAEGTGGVSAVSGGAARPRPYYVALLVQVFGLPPSPSPTPPLLSPPPVQSQWQLQLASLVPGPSPYSGPTRGLTERREPESHPVSPESRPASPESRSASPVRTARAGCRVLRPRPPLVHGTHSKTLCPSTTQQRVPLPSPPASSLPDGPDPESDSLRAASPTVTRFLATAVTDPLFESTTASALVAQLVDFAAACRLDYATSLVAESASASVSPPSVGGECALGTDVLEDRQEEFECFSAAVLHPVSMLLAPEGDLDAPDIPIPRSYAEAIEGPYSSQWQVAMDAEMASWKSTGTYIDEVPPPGANIVSGMWIFRVKWPPGSLPVFKACYVAHGFSQRQGVDFFHNFSPTLKMTTLRAPREWHDTLRTTLDALGFAPSTADPSLFLRIDTTLLPFYVLVYVDDLVFATADTEALAHVKSELQKRHTCKDLFELTSYLGLQITRDRAQRTITLTQSHMVQQVLQHFGFTYSSPQSTPLPTGHSLSAPPSDESVEPSGPYPKLVGCLMYLMTCTRPDLAYPLSLLAHYVAPGRHRKVHWDAAKRVLRFLCSTSGMGLVLGGRARAVLTGHADASWVDDMAMQRSSCEAEIYAGAMATQELCWLTYLLTDLGEVPRSPQVLYIDNKTMLALCQEHRLEHRTKHIALRYFLARELQQRGQLRLAYVASQANTADVFTKALQPFYHQCFSCFVFLDWSCDLLFSPTLPMGPPRFTSCPIRRVNVTPQLSPPQRSVLVVSGGAGGAVAEGKGTGAVGAGGVGPGGARGVGVGVTPVEDTTASTHRHRPTSPTGFPTVPQFPPCSSLRPVGAEPRGVPGGCSGGPGDIGGGGAGSGSAGAGGTGTVAPTPRTVRFLTREQRLLRLEREERERFERAQQQQKQQQQQEEDQSQTQQQERVEDSSSRREQRRGHDCSSRVEVSQPQQERAEDEPQEQQQGQVPSLQTPKEAER